MILGTTDYPTVSVEFAARVLRMNPATLYRNMADVPHTRIGNTYRVYVSLLLFEYVQPPCVASHDRSNDPMQYEFTYDVPIRTVKRYRNGDLKRTGDFEVTLSKKKWRNPVVE